jgi:hypothetical protein
MKQVIDMRPSKGITAAQSDEHQRNWSDRGWDWAEKHGNYDRSREHLNFEVARGGVVQPIDRSLTIPQRMAENLRERGIKDPNEGLAEPKFRTVVNVIFGGSRERMHELAFGDQKVDIAPGSRNPGIGRRREIEQWAQDMYRFACDKWGEQNVIGFIVHLDEMNPHIHATILPIDEQSKRFSYNKVFGGNLYACKAYITRLHDELSVINKRWGLDRGDSVHETGAKHRTTEEYRRELSRECTTLEQQIDDDRAVLTELRSDIRLAQTRVKGLTTMIAHQEENKLTLEARLEALRGHLEAGHGNAENLRKRITGLDLELQKTCANLADKQAKLAVANDKLSELKGIEEEMTQRITGFRHELASTAGDMEQQIQFRISDALLGSVSSEFRLIYPTLDEKSREMFDDSLIQDMAERGEEIFRCALYLYANYVDMATQYAVSHGGGGGSQSSLPWGRKEDEDDRAWALRCLQRAHHMMKPSGSRGVKRK